MVEEELTEEDLAECRKVIYALISMENKSEVLPVPAQTSGTGKSKMLKKEEQYKVMFAELEQFLACHTRTERHVKVLDGLLEVRNKPLSERPAPPRASNEMEVGLKEVDRDSAMTEREKSDFNLSHDGTQFSGKAGQTEELLMESLHSKTDLLACLASTG